MLKQRLQNVSRTRIPNRFHKCRITDQTIDGGNRRRAGARFRMGRQKEQTGCRRGVQTTARSAMKDGPAVSTTLLKCRCPVFDRTEQCQHQVRLMCDHFNIQPPRIISITDERLKDDPTGRKMFRHCPWIASQMFPILGKRTALQGIKQTRRAESKFEVRRPESFRNGRNGTRAETEQLPFGGDAPLEVCVTKLSDQLLGGHVSPTGRTNWKPT